MPFFQASKNSKNSTGQQPHEPDSSTASLYQFGMGSAVAFQGGKTNGIIWNLLQELARI